MEAAIARAIAYFVRTIASEDGRSRIITILLVVLGLFLVALSSPLGIFFAQSDDGRSVQETILELERQRRQRIQAEIDKGGADRVEVVYMGSDDGQPIYNGQDVLNVFAISIGYGDHPAQVFKLSHDQIDELKRIYWNMNRITTQIGEDTQVTQSERLDSDVTSTMSTEDSKAQEEPRGSVKTIYVNSLSYDEVMDEYGFTDRQRALAEKMMSDTFSRLLMPSAGRKFSVDSPTTDEVKAMIAKLPTDLSVQRQKVVESALTLVGKVRYFWGGKSNALGWDDRWGESRKVTVSGSPSSGTIRPFGMDCSGYTRWAFINAGVGVDIIDEVFGDYTGDQWEHSYAISEADAQPGDLAFKGIPGRVKVNHVGIVIGKDDSGAIQIVHCASTPNDVVVTGKGKTFKYFRRPILYGE